MRDCGQEPKPRGRTPVSENTPELAHDSAPNEATAGDPRVDAVVARVDALDPLDPARQLTVFNDIQESLSRILDSGGGTPAGDAGGAPSSSG